jgi:hypothetical protein
LAFFRHERARDGIRRPGVPSQELLELAFAISGDNEGGPVQLVVSWQSDERLE